MKIHKLFTFPRGHVQPLLLRQAVLSGCVLKFQSTLVLCVKKNNGGTFVISGCSIPASNKRIWKWIFVFNIKKYFSKISTNKFQILLRILKGFKKTNFFEISGKMIFYLKKFIFKENLKQFVELSKKIWKILRQLLLVAI